MSLLRCSHLCKAFCFPRKARLQRTFISSDRYLQGTLLLNCGLPFDRGLHLCWDSVPLVLLGVPVRGSPPLGVLCSTVLLSGRCSPACVWVCLQQVCTEHRGQEQMRGVVQACSASLGKQKPRF